MSTYSGLDCWCTGLGLGAECTPTGDQDNLDASNAHKCTSPPGKQHRCIFSSWRSRSRAHGASLALVSTCTKLIISWCKCSVLVQGKVSPRARAGCESVWRVGVRWWPASGGGLPVEDTSGRQDPRTELRTQVEASPWLGSGHIVALAKQAKACN